MKSRYFILRTLSVVCISVAIIAVGGIFPASADAQIISTIAGNGSRGYGGDGGPATSAVLWNPLGITFDNVGDVFFSDIINGRVRMINPSGILTTVVGNGSIGYSGDGGMATAAEIGFADGIVMDKWGNLYIADTYNDVIRKVDASGIISTYAGNGMPGFSGDGGPATAAMLGTPRAVSLDTGGNLFFADRGNNRVRKVDNLGMISTVAGTGAMGFAGDGGAATSALLDTPVCVCTDKLGNLYIADRKNYRIRKVSPAGIISTIAGSGTFSYGAPGDGGPATSAEIFPANISSDDSGNIYEIDESGPGQRVRRISTSGNIATIAGNGVAGYYGDGMCATSAELSSPVWTAVDKHGDIFISEFGNQRVRKITVPSIDIWASTGDTICAGTTVVFTATTSNDSSVSWFQWQLNHSNVGTASSYTTDTLRNGDVISCVLFYVFGDTVKTFSNTITMRVDSFPNAGSITGADTVCIGTAVVLSNPMNGGLWSASNSAAVVAEDTVYGMAIGVDTISYIVTNACGADIAWHTVTVVSCPSLVAGHSTEKDELVVNPNPNCGGFSCALFTPTKQDIFFTVTDIAGRKIAELRAETNATVKIQLDEPPGLYFLRATAANSSWHSKIIIDKK
jgi:trimeric autotransporter adhesin